MNLVANFRGHQVTEQVVTDCSDDVHLQAEMILVQNMKNTEPQWARPDHAFLTGDLLAMFASENDRGLTH